MLDVATSIARILKEEGIEWVSTFPVCRVNNALGKENVPMIMMRDDRYAVALADAYSRMTAGDKIGVCTVQGGVNAAGLQVAYAGLAQAFEDGSPVLCITDGVPVGGSENSQFDVTTSLKSVSKWYGYIDNPSRVPEFMRRAFTMLRSGIKGPVVIAVPNPSAEYDENADPYKPVKNYKYGPDPADVSTALDMISEAKTPIIYAGEGVVYAKASKELLNFAESANIPVATTLKAKGVFPENHPLSVGVRGDHTAKFIHESDLILAIGTSLSPGRFSHSIPNATSKKIIQCNLTELHVNRIFPTAHCLLGDAKHTLNALLKGYSGTNNQNTNSIHQKIAVERQKDLSKYTGPMESSDTPINPYRVYADMMKVLDPKNSFVTHDSGNTRDQLSTIYETHIPRGFLGWGNVSTLGFSLPAAMAAKLAFPERDCIAVSGEAGIGYMLGNLEVPVREKIGITVAHISNGGFSGYGPGFWGEGHDPYTHTVLGYNEVDMSRMIGEIGIHTERVSEPADIIPALNRALEANRNGVPSYIEFICSQYPVYGGWISGSHGE
jgi:thiamine pyrophosphate-dependent acetolactate synthase large subunit-like protein